jgi:hypothetical protein
MQAHGTSQSGRILCIDGYSQTSQGAKLGWHHEQQMDSAPPPYSPSKQSAHTSIEPHVNIIREAVLGQHKSGKTLKAIQHNLRTSYQQKLSLRDIDALIKSA